MTELRARVIAGAPVRDRLALALDLADLAEARALARRLAPYFAIAKVGLELFASAGPSAITALHDDGFDVFLDVKLHDIPITVERSARVIGGLGPRYLTVHSCGGEAMLRAAVEGLAGGASDTGALPPIALAVTVLTTDEHAPVELLVERARLAATAGCGGLVCAAPDLEVVKRAVPSLIAVVPGTRPDVGATDGHARSSTPAGALAAGADMLVIGRLVTAAADPERAAAQLTASLA